MVRPEEAGSPASGQQETISTKCHDNIDFYIDFSVHIFNIFSGRCQETTAAAADGSRPAGPSRRAAHRGPQECDQRAASPRPLWPAGQWTLRSVRRRINAVLGRRRSRTWRPRLGCGLRGADTGRLEAVGPAASGLGALDSESKPVPHRRHAACRRRA